MSRPRRDIGPSTTNRALAAALATIRVHADGTAKLTPRQRDALEEARERIGETKDHD